jgi:hypothetical protein
MNVRQADDGLLIDLDLCTRLRTRAQGHGGGPGPRGSSHRPRPGRRRPVQQPLRRRLVMARQGEGTDLADMDSVSEPGAGAEEHLGHINHAVTKRSVETSSTGRGETE